MKLVYLKKNLNNKNKPLYFYKDQSRPSPTCEIGQVNKRGHTLLYVIYITNNEIFILNSWSDYFDINNKIYKLSLYDHIKFKNKELRNKFAYKLIDLAYKIKK